MNKNRISFNIAYRQQIQDGAFSVGTRDGRPATITYLDFINYMESANKQ